MEPEKPVAWQRLSKYVQTNTQKQERCPLWFCGSTFAKQQLARQWTGLEQLRGKANRLWLNSKRLLFTVRGPCRT
jgi:hypothetical protein